MARPKQYRTALLEPTEDTPARVALAATIADRGERMVRLSAILRDGSGAEVVAAARLLEAMERTDNANSGQGLPAPTSRADQISRLLRILTAFGPKLTMDALEILARRYERSSRLALERRQDGRLMTMEDLHKFRARLGRGAQTGGDNEQDGVSERFEHAAGGTPAEESAGLRELSEAEESVGETSDPDEPARDGGYGFDDEDREQQPPTSG